MRQYLTEWLDVEARGLTPGEAEQALQAAGCNGAFAQRVRTVLEQCEEAQYGKRRRLAAGQWPAPGVIDRLAGADNQNDPESEMIFTRLDSLYIVLPLLLVFAFFKWRRPQELPRPFDAALSAQPNPAGIALRLPSQGA